MVPNGWEVKKFGDLFNVKSGFGFKHSEYADSGTPLIKIDNVSHGYVKWNNVSYLPDSYREEYSDILLKEGDLLLALNRPITQGKLKLVKLTKNDVPSILYQRVGRIDFKTNDLEKDFYLYLLDTAIYRFVSHKAIGSDQPFISTTELKKLNIVKPPLPVQRKIAKILSTWDKAISTTERLIDNSKQQKKALMQQLLTGAHTQRKRLLDDSGKPFEGEWEYVRAGDIFSTRSNKKHDSDLPILAITQDQGAIPREFIDYNVSVTKESISGYKVVENGDFIISLRSFQGGIEYSRYKGICSPAYVILYPKVAIVDAFYKYHLKSHIFIQSMKSRLEGIRDGKIISYKYFSEIKLPKPTLEEQEKIASVLSNADKEIELLEQQLADLKQEKKALMQQLLTGKRRVKVDDKEVV